MANGKQKILLSIVGNRPQFVKLSAVHAAIKAHNGSGNTRIAERIIHTGQHYDDDLSGLFFRQLKIHKPHVNLGIGGDSHGRMTGRMIEKLEEVILEYGPAGVIVYGDTNSTLAGALAASKLAVPLAHVEAGMRSYNRRQPEEINRKLTDHISDLLFCPTRRAVGLLKKEGIQKGVHFTGDVMYDVCRRFSKPDPRIVKKLGLPENFALATFHRQENTDDAERLEGIAEGLMRLSSIIPVVAPLHPRTRLALKRAGRLKAMSQVIDIRAPIGFFELQSGLRLSALVLTDSGGLQKEAYFARVPCVTLRNETEWPETLEDGANRLAGASERKIFAAAGKALETEPRPKKAFGTGHAAEKIVSILDKTWRLT